MAKSKWLKDPWTYWLIFWFFFFFFFCPKLFWPLQWLLRAIIWSNKRERERRKALRWRCRWAWRCIWWEWFGFLWVVGSSLAWLSLTRSLVLLETEILVLSMSDDPIPDSLALLLCVYVLIFLKFHVFFLFFALLFWLESLQFPCETLKLRIIWVNRRHR